MVVFIKVLFVFVVIPIAIGLSGVLISFLGNFSFSYIPFFLGVICYTLTYPVFRKPLTSYIIGHELTHILGVWLSGGKIHSVRIDRHGGMVKADRINLWTTLLPYIFPVYTILALVLYLILSILWDFSRYYNWLVFILGITWAFHFWMTIYVLRMGQPDIRYGGFLFSIVVIFTVNILVLGLLLVFISPELGIWDFINQSVEKIKDSYIWILKRFV